MTNWRRFLLASLLTIPTGLTAAGCSSAQDSTGEGEADVTNVKQSSVKDQSTENCWTYATMGWAESLVETATGKNADYSESYVTYWHWFDQITAGDVTGGVVEEGGSWGEAADLMLKYGIMATKDFVPQDATKELSDRQAVAVKAINEALKTGDLKSGAARRDRAKVRQIMDKAWQLTPEVTAALDATFGADVSKTLATADATKASKMVIHPSDLPVKLKNPSTKRTDTVTLADALGTHKSASDQDHRNGAFAWNDVAYPRAKQARRDFLKRVQRALADGNPVVVNWYVDFNALTADGKFLEPPAKPGSQGGHVVLAVDYQVENVPGFGTLPAGVVETRPAALEAALSDQAIVTFIRIKNSWGTTYHPLPAPAAGGDHDLYLKYLNGPIQECDLDADGNPKAGTCVKAIPFESVVLPAGY
jgi:hypothetical protein